MKINCYRIMSAAVVAVLGMQTAGAEMLTHFPFELEGGRILESVGGSSFAVAGNFTPENVKGVSGNALRFDGYTTFVDAAVGGVAIVSESGPTEVTEAGAWRLLPSEHI